MSIDDQSQILRSRIWAASKQTKANIRSLGMVMPFAKLRRSAYAGSICKKGLHPLTPENIVGKKNGRRCKQCHNNWQKDKRKAA